MAFRVLFLLPLLPATISSSIPTPDIAALLAFKSACSDPAAALSSWSAPADPCSGSWRGVTCVPSSPPRVRSIVLESLRLSGSATAMAAVASLPFLSLLSLKNNSFEGPLNGIDLSPLAPHLKLLYLSGNRFSGRFPESVLHLRHLRRLDLAGNRFSGAIPPLIGLRLPALLTLRLDGNRLVGPIPVSIAEIRGIVEFNVTGNHLEGEIPWRLATVFPASCFTENPGLCGDPLPRRCNGQHRMVGGETAQTTKRWWHKGRWMTAIIAAAAFAVAVTLAAVAVAITVWSKNKRGNKTGSRAAAEAREETVRFEGCSAEFDVGMLMRGAAEMLGKGAAWTTYRVVIGGDMAMTEAQEAEEEVVVVKRVRRGEGGGGKEEERRRRKLAREMGGWRHDNVVSLRAFYASPDELLLVFDYLPNGSLHSLLHDNRGPGRIPLDWPTRLKIAQDAAQGLAYLHGASTCKLSHQHLTSSNILIDDDGDARISDFALIHLLAPTPSPMAMHSSTGETAQKHDVYSFGVILLEILTGRSPEDASVDLPRWVRTVVREEWTSEVFDTELLRCRGTEDEMVALLQVAMLCMADEPRDRPKMSVVSKMIEDIMDRGGRRSRCSPTPSLVCPSGESSPCISEDTTTISSSTH